MQTVEGVAMALATKVAAGQLPPGSPLPSIRSLARERGCAAGTVARAYQSLRDAGVVIGEQRRPLRVAGEGAGCARRLLHGVAPLRLTGSDDPVLDLLLAQLGNEVTVVPSGRGSVNGLGLLARGDADASALHLWHVGTGRHNDDFIRTLCGTLPVTLVHLWRREQVLVLPPGNPKGIGALADLSGRRLAWRHPGSGSRLLLERLLSESGTTASPDHDIVVDSHLGVAVAVVAGAAEAGLAVRAAAESVGAAWIPLVEEPFELAIRSDRIGSAEPLLLALRNPAFRSAVATLPGYDLTACGTMRSAA